MGVLKSIVVRQPRPDDLVDDPVKVCGAGAGFEGGFSARVRDAEGQELKQIPIQAADTARDGRGLRVLGQGWQRDKQGARPGGLRQCPDTALPRFAQYTVQGSDTLGEIARAFYGDSTRWRTVCEANRDQISDPDRVLPGAAGPAMTRGLPGGVPRTKGSA